MSVNKTLTIKIVLPSTYSFVHVARDLNEAVQILAKTAITNVVDNIWLEEIPLCILDIITGDFQVFRS